MLASSSGIVDLELLSNVLGELLWLKCFFFLLRKKSFLIHWINKLK